MGKGGVWWRRLFVREIPGVDHGAALHLLRVCGGWVGDVEQFCYEVVPVFVITGVNECDLAFPVDVEPVAGAATGEFNAVPGD